MIEKILQILKKMEYRLLKNDISAFKVGKSSNVKERFLDDDYNAYDYASVIATSNEYSEISKLEADLIEYFCNHPILKGKCQNQNGGSAGDPNATSVYIVARGVIKSDDNDPNPNLNHLLEKTDLLDLNAIELCY